MCGLCVCVCVCVKKTEWESKDDDASRCALRCRRSVVRRVCRKGGVLGDPPHAVPVSCPAMSGVVGSQGGAARATEQGEKRVCVCVRCVCVCVCVCVCLSLSLSIYIYIYTHMRGVRVHVVIQNAIACRTACAEHIRF